jgi:hypothetical protein
MTPRADLGKHRTPPSGISRQSLQLPQRDARELTRRSHGSGNEGEIGHEISHVSAVARYCFPVEASLEAVVDAVFQQIDEAIPRAILRESRVHADERKRIGLRAFPQMAAEAAQGAADMVWQTVRRVPEQGAATPNGSA